MTIMNYYIELLGIKPVAPLEAKPRCLTSKEKRMYDEWEKARKYM